MGKISEFLCQPCRYLIGLFRNLCQKNDSSSHQGERQPIISPSDGDLTVIDPRVPLELESILSSVGSANPETGNDSERTSHEAESSNTDSDGNSCLTDPQVEELSTKIAAKHMPTIAIQYLKLPYVEVENKRQNDCIAFNRALLFRWRDTNRGINQVQRLADILYAAAEDGGYVDPYEVEKILKVSRERKTVTSDKSIKEAEFLTIAVKLKPHMERRMKIEPFPWLRDYYVDMNKLYTELILEKIENEVLGESIESLTDYQAIFNSNRRDKILTKGEPGMGKTTLLKKIGFDWSKGIFDMFSIIFYVQLKLVKPGEPIENVILQQHPELKGLNISTKNVSTMLERFGHKCLLILDGLDEHGFGKNEDVLKVIRNEKLIDCSIVVSSRPHSVNEVQQHFSTIIRVNGFTKEEAEKFVSNFFTDKYKITQILQFEPSDSRENFPVHKCPILLSILLAGEDEIDLLDKNLAIGDLYLRMVQCLYKKFVIRKAAQFKKSDFLNIMSSVGKLALQTLIRNNSLMERNEVLRIAGKFAFEYGFFAGHEDFRLCTDPTADIYVTYAHRSLEEFFGSYGFIDALNDGKSIDDVLGSDCEEPIFMMNHLVLRFCLWLLTTEEYFNSSKQIYDKLVSYAAKRIDCHTLDTQTVARLFPAININDPHPDNNRLVSNFFKDVFEKCVGIRVVEVNLRHMLVYNLVMPTKIDAILTRFSPNILENLAMLSIDEHLSADLNIDRSVFNILIRTETMRDLPDALRVLLTNYNLLKRNPRVYLTIDDIRSSSRADLIPLITKQIKQLRLFKSFSGKKLFTSCEFSFCPLFTHFTADSYHIDDSVPFAFMKAVKDGKFPNLKRIELRDCKLGDCEWPEVSEFSLEIGAKSVISQMQKMFCQLTELTLENYSDIRHVISKRSEKLAVIKLTNATHHNLLQLNDIVRDSKLPNLSVLVVHTSAFQDSWQFDRFVDEFESDHVQKLEKLSLQLAIIQPEELKLFCQKLPYLHLRELDMSNTRSMTGNLSALFTHSFPKLSILILKSCQLNSNDLAALSQASAEGKLPQLKHLDISEYQEFKINDLFADSNRWNQLTTLSTSDLSVLNVEPEFLPSLEELILLGSKSSDVRVTRSWPRLQILQLDTSECRWEPNRSTNQIIDSVEQGMFPALKRLRHIGLSSSDLFKLYQSNISVEQIY